MAKKEDIEEIKDLVSFLKNALESVSKSSDQFVEKISAAARQNVNLKNVFEELVDNSEDLPKNILNAKDLQEEMLKNTKLFNKVQKESNVLIEKGLQGAWSKINKQLKENKATKEEIKKHEEEFLDLSHRIIQDADKQFLLMKRQAQETRKIKASFIDAKKYVDKLGSALRNPGQAMDGMLNTISALPGRLKEASQEAGGFGKLLAEAGKKAAAYFSVGGILALGIAGLVAPIVLAFRAFSQLYSFLDSKVMPSIANINREFGNMNNGLGNVKNAATSAGVKFEYLGKTFAEGAEAVNKFFSGLKQIPRTKKEAAELADVGLKLSEYVGLSADQSSRLVLQFQKADISMSDLNKTMSTSTVLASKYNVPVNQIRRDMGENIDILSRFGTKNRMVFLESAAKARSYGLSIKDVNAAFGEQMDTFEGTSESSAKLNTIFGTHINSMKLMLERDPTKRMEMLRSELLKQGKSWDNLNEFEQNVITSTLHVNKEQAALVLSSDKARKKLEKQRSEQERHLKINKDWEKGLSNVKETLFALQPRLDRLLRSVANIVGKLLGFKSGSEGITNTTKAMEQFLDNLNNYLENDFFKSPGGQLLSKLFGIKVQVPNEKKYENAWDAIKDGHLELYMLQKKEMSDDERTGRTSKVDDALITKKGQIVKFHQDDNILATKGNPTVNNSNGKDIERIVKSIMSSMKSEVKVEIVDINMDGKKIGEATVRISRY